MSSDFNERSQDAMFARILQRMDTQDATLERIEKSSMVTSGRLDSLERDRWYQRGVSAALSVMAAAAWDFFFGRK